MCSDCEANGLKKHGLTRSDCNHKVVQNMAEAVMVRLWLN